MNKIQQIRRYYAHGGGEMEAKALKHCGICEEDKEHGIHLYTMFICKECEYNIIHTEPREEKYRYYVKKLKNVNQQQLFS